MAATSLLDLPPEVRNLIYFAYLQLHGDAVYVSAARRIITRGPLRKVSQQVRSESESLVDLHARTITFRVHDFEFRYLITFLNKLDKTALDALAAQTTDESSATTTAGPPAKRLKVQLCFSGVDLATVRARMERWLKRFDRPHKKGTAADFEFEVLGGIGSPVQAERMLYGVSQGRYVEPLKKGAQHACVMWEAVREAKDEAEAAAMAARRVASAHWKFKIRCHGCR